MLQYQNRKFGTMFAVMASGEHPRNDPGIEETLHLVERWSLSTNKIPKPKICLAIMGSPQYKVKIYRMPGTRLPVLHLQIRHDKSLHWTSQVRLPGGCDNSFICNGIARYPYSEHNPTLECSGTSLRIQTQILLPALLILKCRSYRAGSLMN